MKYITRTIWILSLVSLFNDAASEMLIPLMPIYLKSIGFSIALIGILEGVAEALAGLSKGYFGKLSDHNGRRAPFVQLGYALSALAKPLTGVFVYPVWVFLMKMTDKIGKGIRTGARDAMLSDEATPESKGTVFGFHRSMDTVGAILGPSLALLYLYFYPGNYRSLFLLAFIPGVFALATSLFLKEKKAGHLPERKRIPFFAFIRYWKESPPMYRNVAGGLLAFTLFNSSDVFLLLKAKQAGFDDTWVIGVYIFYNLIFALFSFPLGILADKIGLKKIFLVGLGLFSVVYFGMAFNTSLYGFFLLFLLYGIYAAATDGISKAWLSNIPEKKDMATALGTFTAFQSICTMIASSAAGLIAFYFSITAAFVCTGVVTVGVIIYFLLGRQGRNVRNYE